MLWSLHVTYRSREFHGQPLCDDLYTSHIDLEFHGDYMCDDLYTSHIDLENYMDNPCVLVSIYLIIIIK